MSTIRDLIELNAWARKAPCFFPLETYRAIEKTPQGARVFPRPIDYKGKSARAMAEHCARSVAYCERDNKPCKKRKQVMRKYHSYSVGSVTTL